MDSRPTAAEPKQSYQPVATWSRVGVNGNGTGPSTPRTTGSSTPTSTFSEPVPLSPYPPTLDLLAPLLFSQHQAQLLQYNKLISPGRGGGGGLQPTSLAGLPQVPNIQAPPRSRSSSKVSHKDGHSSKQSPATQNCHGTRGFKNIERQDCEGMTMEKDTSIIPHEKAKPKPKAKETTPEKTPLKTQPDLAHPLPSRPARSVAQTQQLSNGNSNQSSSVPSTPHQRARNLSFASREPSPTAIQNHSPRSAYSEPNGGVASLPVRQQAPIRPCRFETAQFKQRRRMPYSLGSDRLEKISPEKIKSKLSEDEERKLSTDMRELYDRLLPSPSVEENRTKMVTKLEKIFNDEWPGHDIRVHRFGSSGNLLCSDDSDVDICITTDWKELEGVCIIADLLARRGMEKVVCVSGAKVPIVKMWDPELQLACDMNVNNTLALENTRMIRTYVEIDERVRPLAMVIKHWTRRRVVNDAAYGATLSSYTWICMIVAFLQLREPAVLPALHQMDRCKLPTANGQKSDFADDLEKLRGFGDKNKSTLGVLLFEFFKFFAHEFDYDNMVLSVRLGKLINKKDKTEKEWQHLNNHICVEEPFNKVRNLGNTADEFSFRGLHMEMRRAFDLVAVGKLEECCEQFVFPKQEPAESRAYVKPLPRPAMLRSSSQQQPGRGGRNGGGRGNRNHFRNGNSSRRASSSNAYENAPTSAPAAAAAAALPHPMMAQGHDGSAGDLHQWSQLAQAYHHPAMLSNALMAQQDRMWYQAQLHAALVQAQRMQGHSAQSAGRSRTNSFDQAPPLSAPLRGDYYTWPAHLQQFYAAHAQAQQQQQQQQQQYFTSYPSSPSATAVPEFRRSLHRSNAPNEGSSSNSGMLRSQSQPASRTPAPGGQPVPNFPAGAQTASGVSSYTPRQSNLSPFPAYAADDRTDSEADDVSNRTLPDSPPEEDSAGYLGYFIADSTSPRKPVQGIPVIGDVGMSDASRRRLSTEGPQSVLDRRLQRTSRSPSPLGHGRKVSAGGSSAPSVPPSYPQNGYRPMKESSPLVVNGSTFMPPSTNWFSTNSGETAYDNPLQINQGEAVNGTFTPESSVNSAVSDRPLVVDGSAAQSPIFTPVAGAIPPNPQRMVVPVSSGSLPYSTALGDPSPSNGISAPRNQSGLASLDLAILNPRFSGTQHLSPVYENRIPSPTVSREKPFNQPAESLERSIHKSSSRNGTTKESSTSNGQVNGHPPRENGSGRVTKGEVDNVWHQQKPRKKQGAKGNTGKAAVQSEKPPKDLSERKGG